MSNIINIARFYRSFRKRNPMLYMFLKEHKALKKFSINCKYNIYNIDTIGGAFIWERTKEGHEYWFDLSTKYSFFRRELLNEL